VPVAASKWIAPGPQRQTSERAEYPAEIYLGLSQTRVSIMTLAFPNPARSFDEVRNAVLFFGRNGVSEIRFFVEAGALAISGTALPISGMSEAKCLSVFDAVRMSILEAAREAYSHGRRNYYTLTAADFP
jgi:hypothetical protein